MAYKDPAKKKEHYAAYRAAHKDEAKAYYAAHRKERKAYLKRRHQTPEHKAWVKAYRQTPKYKAAKREREQRPAAKAQRARYEHARWQLPERKAVNRKAVRKYYAANPEKCAARIAAWCETLAGQTSRFKSNIKQLARQRGN